MKFFLHIKTNFDALVEINNIDLGLIKKNDLEPLGLEVDSNVDFYINAKPVSDEDDNNRRLLPYLTRLYFVRGELVCSNNLITITEYPNKHFELILKQNSLINHSMPKVLAQKTYNVKGSTHTATVFFDGINQVSIEGKEMLFNKEIKERIDTVEIEKIKNKNILIIKADTKENDLYALILGYDNGDYNVLKEAIVNKIEQEDGKVTLLTKVKDIAHHGLVQVYNLDNNKLEKEEAYTVYLNEEPIKTTKAQIVPFAFLQAISVKNFELARTYLDEQINEQLEDEHLTAYFDNFIEIKPVIYEEDPKNKVALIYEDKKRVAKIFLMEIENNLITNIHNV